MEYTDKMLNFHKSNEATNAASSSSLWGNVTQPIMKQNTKKFLKSMTDEEIEIFESVAGDVLDALGYERVRIAQGAEIPFTPADIEKFNEINQARKSEISEQMDPEDRERRSIQANLLDEIQARKAA
ncbi:hypothetical protein Xen7305DRAFT_00015640 [Xenococcus sp. PCC 7305]|nr:hypothetical protein Xen7305DRAFT_00015640 [Xenococcus sp. PCC 7305]